MAVRVGMESSGHSRWFERLLHELGFELWIGDPAEIQTKRVRKQKTDRQDAQLLLRLMIENRFPRIWKNKILLGIALLAVCLFAMSHFEAPFAQFTRVHVHGGNLL
jgi:hypothetical protein